jgi:hypothetical protein
MHLRCIIYPEEEETDALRRCHGAQQRYEQRSGDG